jgi:hypothetical protein
VETSTTTPRSFTRATANLDPTTWTEARDDGEEEEEREEEERGEEVEEASPLSEEAEKAPLRRILEIS